MQKRGRRRAAMWRREKDKQRLETKDWQRHPVQALVFLRPLRKMNNLQKKYRYEKGQKAYAESSVEGSIQSAICCEAQAQTCTRRIDAHDDATTSPASTTLVKRHVAQLRVSTRTSNTTPTASAPAQLPTPSAVPVEEMRSVWESETSPVKIKEIKESKMN